jgi:hypothetical protein
MLSHVLYCNAMLSLFCSSAKKPPPASTGFFDNIQGNILSLVTPRKAVAADAFSPSPSLPSPARLQRSPPKGLAPKPNQPAQNLRLNTDERRQLLTVKLLLHSYLSIVKKNVGDSVPKTLMTLLVNHVQSNLSKHLVSLCVVCLAAASCLFPCCT